MPLEKSRADAIVAPALVYWGYQRPLPSSNLRGCRQGIDLLLEFLLDALGQHGDNLVEVAHDTQVSNAEDGSELVLVDGDDEVTLFHTCQVLDGTADTASHVEVGTDGLTGLTYLYLVRHHTVVNHGT